MGIPAFFRFITKKYMKVTTNVKEELEQVVDGIVVPVDVTKKNPNDIEFDNLYLDMNGIIHPCCHPEDKPAPENEDLMYVEIFNYIDRIVAMVRPRKLIYMAIDGVAPRAKMNQQRSRRFRAAAEEQAKIDQIEQERDNWVARGGQLQSLPENDRFDSNCITPGTPFMERLAVCLRYYIQERLSNAPGWTDLKIVLSDASVPGEGEHKIMDFIRKQRYQQGYDPNTKHVLYGLDADLIMLALSTHEPYFWILREDVSFKNAKEITCHICGTTGHYSNQCSGQKPERSGEFDEKTKYSPIKPFILFHVNILREYLSSELYIKNLPFVWDPQRAIDDWIFLCFFVGNDFLPHIPSLDIREGALDSLVNIWKQNIREWGSYITDSGELNLTIVEQLMFKMGQVEDKAFVERRKADENRRMARLRKKKEQKMNRMEREAFRHNEQRKKLADVDYTQTLALEAFSVKRTDREENMEAAKRLKMMLQSQKKEVIAEKQTETSNVDLKRADDDSSTKNLNADSDDEAPMDSVRLWEFGWKERYYEEKFHVDISDTSFRSKVAKAYVEGLCWVLKYYYQGVPSWHWFYPYHYSPFASDFVSIKHLHFHFELGIPFKPFEQLMGVLPSHSKSHLPLPFHDLMTESYSSIYDFYPIDFPIDLNGKKYAWQGVAILPFIDAQRLLDAMKPVYASLTNEETKRNSFGETVLFCGNGSKLFHEACRVYATKDIPEKGLVINHLKSGNIFGKIRADPEICFPGSNYQSPLGNCGLRDINPVESVSVVFHMPEYPLGYRFISKMLPGVIMQPRVLDRNDQNMIRSGMPANRDNHHNNNNRSIANAPSVYKRQNDRYEKRDYTRNESSYQQGGRASTYQNNLQSNNNRAQQFGGNRPRNAFSSNMQQQPFGGSRPQNAFSSNMQQQPFGGSRPQNAFTSEAYATRLANSTHIRQGQESNSAAANHVHALLNMLGSNNRNDLSQFSQDSSKKSPQNGNRN